MGCVASSDDLKGSAEARARHGEIERILKKGRTDASSVIKLLLLGTGESGKSTIAKQLKIIHLNGFTEKELASFKQVIWNTALEAIKVLIEGAKKFGYRFSSKSVEKKARSMLVVLENLTPDHGQIIRQLWSEKAIKKTYKRRSELQVPDSSQYMFNNISRICAPGYLPTTEDVLRARARTTGIVETKFTLGESKFCLVDVGGQRSERKKWLHCFQEVTAVLYCIALNEYDMQLFEDANINRMREALELFENICNSKWFVRTSFILFLNKNDLFLEKIKRVDLKVCFPEYTGGCDYLTASKFLEDKFKSVNNSPTKSIYTHITTATDTENIRFVFNAVKDIIIEASILLSYT